MPETSAFLVLLSVLTTCVVAMTAAIILMAASLRRMLWSLNRLLPDAEQALRDARVSLDQVRQVATRVNGASQQVEAVVHQACETASTMVGAMGRLTERTRSLMSGWFGNGGATAPRRHHRNR